MSWLMSLKVVHIALIVDCFRNFAAFTRCCPSYKMYPLVLFVTRIGGHNFGSLLTSDSKLFGSISLMASSPAPSTTSLRFTTSLMFRVRLSLSSWTSCNDMVYSPLVLVTSGSFYSCVRVTSTAFQG